MNKTLRLNIYLTNEDKKQLSILKYKYHLSYSTIARLIAETLFSPQMKASLNETYIYTEDKGQTRTSIKPRKWTTLDQDKWITAPTIFYTNVLKLYLRNDLLNKRIVDKEEYPKFNKQLYKKFETEKDENWNGNEWQRKLPKFIKQNKEYYRKLLNEE